MDSMIIMTVMIRLTIAMDSSLTWIFVYRVTGGYRVSEGSLRWVIGASEVRCVGGEGVERIQRG